MSEDTMERLSPTYTEMKAGYVKNDSYREVKVSFFIDGQRYSFRTTPEGLKNIAHEAHKEIRKVEL